MIWIIIVAVITLLDRAAKYLVIKNIDPSQSITIINNFFYLVHGENTGAALGMLENGRIILVPVTLITASAIAYVIYKAENKLLKVSLSFILGGAVGNLIDRIFRGSVTDFLDFKFGSFHFWTFNVADIFVVVGTALLTYYLIFMYKEQPAANKQGTEETDKEE